VSLETKVGKHLCHHGVSHKTVYMKVADKGNWYEEAQAKYSIRKVILK